MKKSRYYIPERNDGVFKRIKNTIYGKKIKPFPETIIIETITGCNAKCIFCEAHKLREKLPSGKISSDLLTKIIAEGARYEGLLKKMCFHFDNEPLLDSDLIRKISHVKENCSFVRTNITSNGILLTKNKIEEIYKSESVDEINISIQSIKKESYERITGVKTYDKIIENIEDLASIHRNYSGKKPEIEINVCLTSEAISEKKEVKKFWDSKGFKLHYIKIDNRSHSKSNYFRSFKEPTLYYPYCRRPFHTMVVCFDGTVPICCADYRRSCTVGDLNTSSVYDVWNGEQMIKVRKELIEGKFESAKICSTCMIAN